MTMGTYCGPIEALRGKRAMLREDDVFPDIWVRAQFNLYPPEMTMNNDGGPFNYLCFAWHHFPRDQFEVDEE